MAELLLPGDILSMTARAADRLMGAGNGDAALLYLWLLRRGGRLEPEAARRALKWDVPRLEAALSALVGLGLADGTAAPEAIVAGHCGMQVLGFTLCSNMAAGILDQPLSEQEVLDAAEACKEKFSRLVLACLKKLS